MDRRALILKNSKYEGPGSFTTVLKANRITYDLVDFTAERFRPLIEKIKSYHCLIVLGGPDSANDKTDKIIKEIILVKKWLSLSRPYLGICLGLQLLVKAAGGKVVKNPVKEIGFRDPLGEIFEIKLTKKGKSDPLFNNLKSHLRTFQLHGETVELTREMKLLAIGKFCRRQAVKVGKKAYGLQCHFEITEPWLNLLVEHDKDLAKIRRKGLIPDFLEIQPECERTNQQLFHNFLNIN